MIRYIQAALVLLYALSIAFAFLLTLEGTGIFISETAGWLITISWCLLCFLSSYVNGMLYPIFSPNSRIADHEEEKKFRRCIQDVLLKSSCEWSFDLRISRLGKEKDWPSGRLTIVMNEKWLSLATDEELKGLLAQELGHRLDNDCLFEAAFATAGLLPRLIVGTFHFVSRHCIRPMIFILPFRIIMWSLLFCLLYWMHMLQMLFLIMAFAGLTCFFLALFSRCFRFVSAFREYHQDAFAARLGYGPGLIGALKKSIEEKEEKYVIHNPLIIKRIRRLEKIERDARFGGIVY